MIEYGITTSTAAVWFHVCPLDAAAYFYARTRMLKILPTLREVEIPSARGRLCRLFGNRVCDGGFIYRADLEPDWFDGWSAAASDTAAGDLAERVFEISVTHRRFQIPAKATRFNERAEQFTGKDFEVTPLAPSLTVEVKADFVGGEWGSGNLFVQTHELHHKHGERNAHREVA